MNLIGLQFGSLTVTSSAVRSGRSWCLCDCGGKKITLPNHRLLDGTRTHCGGRIHALRDSTGPGANGTVLQQEKQ